MINPIYQIAKLITEHPDIINHNILLESLESKIKKLLTKLSNKLPHEVNIDEITQFATQQRFKELEISRWIAKQVAFNPNLRVDWTLLTDYIAHLKFRDNNKYKTLIKSKIQEIIEDAEKWHSQSQNNEPIIAEFPNGYRIVKLTKKEHCEVEGELMDNCVKDYDPKETDLYSLRSPDGKPKVTIQVLKDGKINELKGRQNKPPVKKYAELIIPWVNSILNDPSRLFDDPDINFTSKGFNDYVGSLSDDLLVKFAKSKNSTVRLKMANLALTGKISQDSRTLPVPSNSVEILKILAIDNDQSIRRVIANSVKTPVKILKLLAKDSDILIRGTVARNSNTPSSILKTLSNDDKYVLRGLASNRNTSASIIRNLYYQNDSQIKTGVAGNPNAPKDILRILSKDEDHYVRQAVAENPNTQNDILENLSKDKNDDVKVRVAYNHAAPSYILKDLANDDFWFVRDAVAKNRNTPSNILRMLFNDKSHFVRTSVISNPNTPLDLLRELANNANLSIRLLMSRKSTIPIEIIKILTNDRHWKVKENAIQNLNRRQNPED